MPCFLNHTMYYYSYYSSSSLGDAVLAGKYLATDIPNTWAWIRPSLVWSQRSGLKHTGCPNKMLTLFDLVNLTVAQSRRHMRFHWLSRTGSKWTLSDWNWSLQSKVTMARRLSLELCLVRFLHWNVHNNDFGLIFYGVKHTGPDQADFHGQSSNNHNFW